MRFDIERGDFFAGPGVVFIGFSLWRLERKVLTLERTLVIAILPLHFCLKGPGK